MISRKLVLITLFASTLGGCNKNASDTQKTGSTQTSGNKAADNEDKSTKKDIEGPNARTRCEKPKSTTLSTVTDLVNLLNALPKPVSVACLIDVLDRPLTVAATSNFFSGQPATGPKSPRIFLYINDSLTLSVVPTGDSAKVVEFGYKTSDTTTVKGEIQFPITETVAQDVGYAPILSRDKSSSLCIGCHYPETPAPSFGPLAFQSMIVPIDPHYEFTFDDLKRLNIDCGKEKSDECEIIQAIFFGDQVSSKSSE